MGDNVCIVLVTAPSQEVAAQLGQTLVGEKLAACVNLIPVTASIYHWEGAIQSEPEVLLMVKTVQNKLKALEARIYELHPYATPEFVVIDPKEVGKKYTAWVNDCLK